MNKNKSSQRILVVDDLPDMRTTIVGLFEDEGYYVQSASSRKEALDKLKLDYFHVAVLDIRLDDTDDDNTDGMKLIGDIRGIDLSMVPIILSGYIDFKIYEEAQSLDIAIVDKANLLKILDVVEKTFVSKVNINWDLDIVDDEDYFSEIPKKIRIKQSPKLSEEQIQDESDQIIRKLFSDAKYQRVTINPIRRGYSGTIILKIIPRYRNYGDGEVIVAKIGERRLIQGEINRHRSIQGQAGGHRIPNQLETADTRSLSGIIYTFAGLGDAQDFVTFYENSSQDKIIDTIADLFNKTCFPGRYESITNKMVKLRGIYNELLRLNPEKLSSALRKTMGGRHPFNLSDDAQFIILDNGESLTNPVALIEENELETLSCTATIHGDLHGFNVLVDRRQETWLIDFTDTGPGPLWQDFTLFETFLNTTLIETKDWHLLYQWENLLANNIDLDNISLPDSLTEIPNIQKLFSTIQTIRKIALSYGMSETIDAYRIGLLFNAVRTITIFSLPAAQRDHALISASLVAGKLRGSLVS